MTDGMGTVEGNGTRNATTVVWQWAISIAVSVFSAAVMVAAGWGALQARVNQLDLKLQEHISVSERDQNARIDDMTRVLYAHMATPAHPVAEERTATLTRRIERLERMVEVSKGQP